MTLVTAVDDQDWKVWDDPVRGCLRWCLLDDGADPSPGVVTTGVLDLAPDGWLGRHRHTAPETYYVLDGEVVVTLADEEVAVGPGTLVRLPPDIEHGIRAVGGSARVLFVFPTVAFDDVAYRFDAEA